MAGIVDTLKYFERLRAAGLDERAARAIAEGQHEALAATLATRGDLELLKADLELAKAELRSEIQALRAEVRAELHYLSGWVKGLYVYVTLAVALIAALAHWRVI